jgi:hypothetical protein
MAKIPKKEEIIYNIVNSALAGALVLLGSFSSGDVSGKAFLFAFMASGAVAVAKFKDFWEKGGNKGGKTPLFNFI